MISIMIQSLKTHRACKANTINNETPTAQHRATEELLGFKRDVYANTHTEQSLKNLQLVCQFATVL